MLSLNPLSKFLSLFHSSSIDEATIFRSDIISGPIWESFLVQFGNQFRSNLGIICGPVQIFKIQEAKKKSKVNTPRSVGREEITINSLPLLLSELHKCTNRFRSTI